MNDWTVFKALRAPFSQEVWDLTLQELRACPRCDAGTVFIPFPAGGASTEGLQALAPEEMPPLDAAVFLCAQPECLTLYLIIFNAERQAEFEALIPALREAGRRAVGG